VIRLSTHEQIFRRDADARIQQADFALINGTDADRETIAKDWREAGHALIAAAEALRLRVAEEQERAP